MHAVSAEGPLSRAAVSSRIGLTRAAVSTLVDELIRTGLLEELGPERPGRVGRPGSALAVSGRGPRRHRRRDRRRPSRGLRCRPARPGAFACRTASREPGPLPGAGDRGADRDWCAGSSRRRTAKACGPRGSRWPCRDWWRADARTVVRAPNLDWHDTDLGALLPTDIPLTVDNEANFGALAELWLGDEHSPRLPARVGGDRHRRGGRRGRAAAARDAWFRGRAGACAGAAGGARVPVRRARLSGAVRR